MPKPKLVKTIDAKIREVQARMAAAKARYNSLSTQLAELQAEREELIGKEGVCKNFCVSWNNARPFRPPTP